ncbi:MAG: FecCD family ABC transporter permease [Cytophagaceae bacterium]
MNRRNSWLILLVLSVLGFFVLDIISGSVNIPLRNIFAIVSGSEKETAWADILFTFRLPKAFTAMMAGAGLAVSGLQMQTLFRNPLAGPYVLGVSSGASLAVALLVMAAPFTGAFFGSFMPQLSIIFAACLGSVLSLFLIMLVAERIRENSTLLIIGLMLGHLTSALVGVLQYFSTAGDLQSFILWSLGSFSNVVSSQLKLLFPILAGGLFLSFLFSKPLNALLLGESYARSMGVNIRTSRFWIMVSAGMLAGSITAFCGPIAFLGLAVPHLCKALFKTSDHRFLVPAVALMGALLALGCDIASQLPGKGITLPINAVTSLIGAPVVIWIILSQRKY